jgi:predicted HAD superfamily hydrolase
MKFAVGYINFFDNDLIIEVIEANNWKLALSKHSHLINSGIDLFFGDTLENVKVQAFNCDMMIDVVLLDEDC